MSRRPARHLTAATVPLGHYQLCVFGSVMDTNAASCD